MTHDAQPEQGDTPRPPPRPRWVIWLIIGVVVAVVLFLVLHLLTGGGRMNHGGNQSGMSLGMPSPIAVIAGS